MSDECEEDLGSRGRVEVEGSPAGKTWKGRNQVLAIWALALFTAFLFGCTIANVIITRQAYQGAKSQTEAIRALNDSMLEIRKTIAEFSGLFQEAQEFDRWADDGSSMQKPFLGDEKV